MNDRPIPRLHKWPFFLADAALLGVAAWVLFHYPHPLEPWAGGLIAGCVILAAWLGVWPFRLEYEAAVRAFESDRVVDATEAIRNLESVSGQIQGATSQWQGVQEHATRTTQAAQEIAERISTEARAFSEFMAKANDSEKATLRLEADKLRRNEGQWLQVLVHTLDHVHALCQAGARSGQPNVAAQLATFQGACRDLARRVGLNAIDAELEEPFDQNRHEPMPGQEVPAGPARVAQIVAAGYAYQGQLLRRPIVALKPDEQAPAPEQEFTPSDPALAAGVTSEATEPSSDPAQAAPETLAEIEPLPSVEPAEAIAAAAIASDSQEPAAVETVGETVTVDEFLAANVDTVPETDTASAADLEPPGTQSFEIHGDERVSDQPTLAQPEAAVGPESGPESLEEFRLESDPDIRRRRRAGG